MPAFRILYVRDGSGRSETITAAFEDLDQAMNVFATRGFSILYITEQCREARRLDSMVGEAERKAGAKPVRSSFPIRRYSARALA